MSDATVLYVEDDENAVFFMRFGFEQAGLQNPLQVATTGQEAIDYLAGNAPFADRGKYPLPGLVLLDVNLPMVPGFDVLKWIRNQPQFESLPVVMISASDSDDDKENARRLGAQDFMVKTFDIYELPPAVGKLVGRWAGGC